MATFPVLMFSGCSKSVSQDQANAQILLDGARSHIDNGNPQAALNLLDSLDNTYKNETQIINESMRMRPEAIEALAMIQIAETDSLITAMTHHLDSLAPLMTKVNLPQTEGYFVASEGYDRSFMNKTGLSARVSEIGQFYIVSSVNPSSGINHWSVSAISGGQSATTDTVPYDGILNYHINNSELISFSTAQCDTIGKFVFINRKKPITIIFNGQKGKNRQIKLSTHQINAIATAYDYAHTVNQLRTSALEKERLGKRIQLAKEQLSRLNAHDGNQ